MTPSLPAATSPFRWSFNELNNGIFRIHDRTLFSLIVISSVALLASVIFLYTRWVCRFRDSHPPAEPAASVVLHLPPRASPRRGLDLSEIEKMPIVLFKNLAGGKFYEGECCICLGVFADKERVKVLPQCRHCFHSECLDKWLTGQSSCPLCRASLGVDSPV